MPLNTGGLEEPDIVTKVATDKAEFIDFENSEKTVCMGNFDAIFVVL